MSTCVHVEAKTSIMLLLTFFKVHFVYKYFTFMYVYVPCECLSEDEVRFPKIGVTDGVNHQVDLERTLRSSARAGSTFSH